MTKLLLSIHVLAAIIFVGPVTVAASMFPPLARRTLEAPEAGDARGLGTLHRITRVYAFAAASVPVFGVATASSMGVLGNAWLIASMVLTGLAAGILLLSVVPHQAHVLAALDGAAAGRDQAVRSARMLSMTSGLFALTWSIVVVLMITRPGSTTGA